MIILIKYITIYRNVEYLDVFHKFYTEEVLPRAQKIPDIISMNLTKIQQQLNEQVSPDLEKLQLFMELHFESEEAMRRVLESINGQELMRIIEEGSPGNISYFIGKENRFDADILKSGQGQKFIEQPKWNS